MTTPRSIFRPLFGNMDRRSRFTEGGPHRPWTSRWLGWLVALGLALAFLLVPVACTTTLIPPRHLAEPTTVFLLDHGRTASLVLPDDADGMVRYGYGDWAWYALGRTGVIKAIPTLFWPTQGAMGRLELSGPVNAQSIRRQLHAGIEHLYEIPVERHAVQRLREELDRIYQENLDTRVVTESVDFAFVHHPEAYTACHNSNHVTAGWLRRLGVRTDGPAFSSRWRIKPVGSGPPV